MRKQRASRAKRAAGSTITEEIRSENEFAIEVAWRLQSEKDEDPCWKPIKMKKSRSGREAICWWPAIVIPTSVSENKYEVVYTKSWHSTSLEDLHYYSRCLITFLDKSVLKHTSGPEKGKVSEWRFAEWTSEEINSDAKGHDSEIVALRGAIVNLENRLQSEMESRKKLEHHSPFDRKSCLCDIERVTTTKLKRFWAASITQSLLLAGKDHKPNIGTSKSNNNVVSQFLARIKPVDCTLGEFRELGRMADSLHGMNVKFEPSTFNVNLCNMRQKVRISIVFDSFSSLCSLMNLKRGVDLLIQKTLDNECETTSYQFVGQYLEMQSKGSENNQYNEEKHVPECVILIGYSSLFLERNVGKQGPVIYRPRSVWNDENGIADEHFMVENRNASELISTSNEPTGTENSVYRFKLEWEPLNANYSCIGGPINEHEILGKLISIVPMITINSIKDVRNLDHLFKMNNCRLLNPESWK